MCQNWLGELCELSECGWIKSDNIHQPYTKRNKHENGPTYFLTAQVVVVVVIVGM